jgi:hypothetical protein
MARCPARRYSALKRRSVLSCKALVKKEGEVRRD